MKRADASATRSAADADLVRGAHALGGVARPRSPVHLDRTYGVAPGVIISGVPRDGDLQLRDFRDGDAEELTALLSEPAVKRWWPDGAFQREYGWVVDVGERLAGWIEYHEESYEWFPSVALDIALTSGLHGRGYGRRVLTLAIKHFLAKGHHRFTIDPRVDNERAIRCYAAVGFKPVGVLRAYERNPAGGWSDALLMDLVVQDGRWE